MSPYRNPLVSVRARPGTENSPPLSARCSSRDTSDTDVIRQDPSAGGVLRHDRRGAVFGRNVIRDVDVHTTPTLMREDDQDEQHSAGKDPSRNNCTIVDADASLYGA